MRGVKPHRAGFLTRPYTFGRRQWLGVTVTAFICLDEPDVLLPEIAMWELVGRRLGATAIDQGIPKREGELLACATAYPGAAQTTCPVRIRVGAIDKSLHVVGDRRWERGVPTAPEPFEAMPLSWDRAFGGPGCVENPVGRGLAPDPRLPNVTLPGAVTRDETDRPAPASFAPLEPAHPLRAGRVGTYDQRWLEEDYPGFASDVDWRTFNLAPDDQRAPGPLVPGDPIELHYLHPTRAEIHSRLPNHVARAAVRRDGAWTDVAVAPTTVWLFPEDLAAIVIHHGVIEIAEDDARDVEAVVIGFDGAEERRPTAHFAEVLAARTDKEDPRRSFEASRSDAALLPKGHPDAVDSHAADEARFTPKRRRFERQWARARRKVEVARDELRAMGLDPDTHGPVGGLGAAPPAPSGPAAWDRLAALEQRLEDAEGEAESRRAEGRAELAATYEKHGLSIEEHDRVAERAGCGPPDFDADAERARMAELAGKARRAGVPMSFLEAYESRPDQRAFLDDSERRAREAYRRYAHLQRPVPPFDDEAARARGEALLQRLAAGEPVREIDFTGADLRGADLSGADLRRAWLESARLERANLDGALLDGAVLTRAHLEGAVLLDAVLTEANLGGAHLDGADLRRARLDAAVLSGVSGRGTRLARARLTGADLTDAALDGADLEGATLEDAVLSRASLTSCRFVGATLARAAFLEQDLSGSVFDDARMDRAVFFSVNAAGARFVGATLTRAVFTAGTSLTGADLRRANLSEANLRGAPMRGADLRGARLTGADLSEAELDEARLEGVSARGSRWIRASLRGARLDGADLMEALLSKADVSSATLDGASLYGADLSQIRSDERTTVEGADSTRARVKPVWRPREAL